MLQRRPSKQSDDDAGEGRSVDLRVRYLVGHLRQPQSDCRTLRQLSPDDQQSVQQLSQDLMGVCPQNNSFVCGKGSLKATRRHKQRQEDSWL